jgi:hypothetical protein
MKKKYIIAEILLLLVFSYMPFNLTIAPKREFTVLDSSDRPVGNALAKQAWYQYSLRYTEEAELRSDINGKISFPRRVVKTSLVSLISKGIGKIIEYKLDASIGSTDTIGVFVEGHDWKWFYDGIGLDSGVVKFEAESMRP